jgi:uncharacterized pyridoxamine 5'-phosphate oxidase family protein
MKRLKTIILFGLLAVVFGIAANAQNIQNDSILKKNQAMKEVCKFLKQCGTYFIATVDEDQTDQPRVRPFGTVAIFENKLYIQTGKQKKVAKQMLKNSKIEICAYDKDKQQWIRIEAIVQPDEGKEAKQNILDQYPSLKEKYSADDNNTLVLYLKDVTAILYSFSDDPKVFKF